MSLNKKPKLSFNELYLCITRRCNQECKGYCLRGHAQNVDMSFDIIDDLFDNYNLQIGRLFLGGGEPTMVPDIIDYIARKMINNKQRVKSIGIVTNGIHYEPKIIEPLNEMAAYTTTLINGRTLMRDNSFLVSANNHQIPYSKEVYASYASNLKGFEIGLYKIESVIKDGLAFESIEKKPKYIGPIASTYFNNVLHFGMISMSVYGELCQRRVFTYDDEDTLNEGTVKEYISKKYR